MAYWIKNFTGYIDTWLETDYPKDYTIQQYTKKTKNGKLITDVMACIEDDRTLEWALEAQHIYNFEVIQDFYVYNTTSKGRWDINKKDIKYINQYYINPQTDNFIQEYYIMKNLVCYEFENPFTKNEMVENLCINDKNEVCLYLNNASLSDKIFMKMKTNNLIH